MSKPDELDVAEQLDRLLGVADHTWLLAAGVSFAAKIPLMRQLTKVVLDRAVKDIFAGIPDAVQLINDVVGDVGGDSHIEHYLSHMQDLYTVADRSEAKTVTLAGTHYARDLIRDTHMKLLSLIAEVVRWGYVEADAATGTAEQVGTPGSPIVDVSHHRKFVCALFDRNRAGLSNRRGPVKFFSTNYDTLLEDALAIEGRRYVDGFLGGAVAFWEPAAFERPDVDAVVYKVHGSIDWRRTPDGKLLRARSGDLYPAEDAPVLIYPQATKYVASRRDPFEWLLRRMREVLCSIGDQVLFVCGYSFGDEHLNGEIEESLMTRDCRTTAVILLWTSAPGEFPPAVRRLITTLRERVYILTPYGLYQGENGPYFEDASGSLGWWTFDGATSLLQRGVAAFTPTAAV
jgi:hypothetical protein